MTHMLVLIENQELTNHDIVVSESESKSSRFKCEVQR